MKTITQEYRPSKRVEDQRVVLWGKAGGVGMKMVMQRPPHVGDGAAQQCAVELSATGASARCY